MNEQQQAAMRQALEALEADSIPVEKYGKAITDLRQALEQHPSDIPKIGCVNHDCDKCKALEQQPADDKGGVCGRCGGLVYDPVIPQNAEADEPVAFLDWYDNAIWGNEDFKAGCWRAWDAALEHTRPQPAAPSMFGGGLVAIKTLLSRDPCAHAKVAIEMIDAMLAAAPEQPADEIQRLSALVRAQQITIDKLEQQPADKPITAVEKLETGQQALFEHWWDYIGSMAPERGADIYEHCKKQCALAWEAALEQQPADEPVACLVETEQGVMVWPIADYDEAGTYCDIDALPVPLYTRPQPAAQWVGLTKTIVGNHLRNHMLGDQPTFRQGFKEGAVFAEAKLRERNGGKA